jgi:hypothetical protein
VSSSLNGADETMTINKSNLGKNLNKSDPSLNNINVNNNYNGASILADLNRQSLEISPITVDLQANNSINANSNNKRYFYRYLLNKKYNSSNLPQQIFANVVVPAAVAAAAAAATSTNNGTNKSCSNGGAAAADFQSSSSFSIRSQPKEYLIANLGTSGNNNALNEQIDPPHGGIKLKMPAYQSQPNMSEFVEGASRLIAKSDEYASRKLSFRETFGKGKTNNNKENIIDTNVNNANTNASSHSNNSNNSQTTQAQMPPFQTQFRLKPLQNKTNTTNTNANLDLCDDSSPFINLKIEKKVTCRVERVPIKLRTLNKFEDLTITSNTQNTTNTTTTPTTTTNSNSSTSTTPPITQQQNVNSKTKLAKLVNTPPVPAKQKFTSSYSSFNRFNFEDKEKEKSQLLLVSSPSQPLSNDTTMITAAIKQPIENTNKSNNNSSHRYGVSKGFNGKLESLSFDIEFTRVASPHVLGKSTNDFKFISNSSVNLNTKNRNRLNHHFEMFQSNLYDTNLSLNNNNLNLISNTNNNNNNNNNTHTNNSSSFSCSNGRNGAENTMSDSRKMSKTFNFQKLSVFGNCLS